MANPNRGEVWLVDLGYAAKVRPCLVLKQDFKDEYRALLIKYEIDYDEQYVWD